ncbi:primosomal protein N' [Paractinoplanes toevensis]|uniref:Probable replication restart protein PriA n=1 Tax=Paractinoplanes toevensis TaxID=571911 RepID=A0A919WCR4_9ACTN|nr:primosomal protein N' [Actinoplanes toevensis]GIM97688.1 hypothetical protein Ato02nite_094810 [Actinoplanes toevensis]
MTSKSARSERVPAERSPVARVCVDVPLPHLDRPFDYLVAAADDEAAQPGVRVKVRFAGQLVTGFLLERAESSPHGGKLAYLDKIVSPERVLDPEVARLARAVADRYAGNLCDVLRLAVPPRHARVEAQAKKSDKPDLSGMEVPAGEQGVGAAPIADGPHTGATAADQATARVATADSAAAPAAAGVAGGEATAIGPAAGWAGSGPTTGPAVGLTAVGPAATSSAAGEIRAGAATVLAASQVAAGGMAGLAAGEVAAGAVASEVAAGGLAVGGLQAGAVTAGPAVGGPAAGEGTARRAGGEPGDGGVVAVLPPGKGLPAAGGWDSYVAGAAFLRALEDGRSPRAVWGVLPGEDWAVRIAEAAAATVRAGLGVVIVVADARDLERVDRALGSVLGDGLHVALNAALGPAERYRRFLAASRHQVPVVVGTRAAMWAPVAKLGLLVIWDDGDDLHAEPRSPYPHAREVLLTRARLADCAVLVGGHARTGEGQLLLETGWAKEISASRDVLRKRVPAIAPTGDDPQLARDPGAATARLPSLAWEAARQALKAGAPVLVQVPRRGYLPSVACAECRTPARCPHCSGPLSLAGARDVPTCRWCGRAAADYSCPACGGRRLRASITGARRTAEELGRAFPDIPVRTSGRDEILDGVPGTASVVVATPGAEPVAEGGYGAVLLLDTWALLTRSDLRAAEETMRRWLTASALARPAKAGGRVVVVADGSLATVQALIRWDPGWFAARELAERRELGFPPAARMASLTGVAEAVAELLDAAKLPDSAEILGPVPADEGQERMLVRTSRSQAGAMAHALHEAAAVRSAKRAALPVRIEVDPAMMF